MEYLGQIAAAAVILGFVLYTIGFLVWRSYLGQYGVSVGFVQLNFVSAALCYLFICANVALPMLFVSELCPHGDSQSTIIVPLALLWAGGNVLFTLRGWFTKRIAWAVAAAVVLLSEAMAFEDGIPPSVLICRILRFLILDVNQNPLLKGVFLVTSSVLSVICLLCWKDHNKCFLCKTIFISLTVLFSVSLVGTEGPHSTMVWIAFAMILLVLVFHHVRWFGREQFSKLPREMGGGQPEVATLEFRDSSDPSSHHKSREVEILFRSDLEAIYLEQLALPKATRIRMDDINRIVFANRSS